MKKNYIKSVILSVVSLILLNCEKQETEFGFDSSLQGTVLDNDGTPLHGDLSSNNLVVKLLGDGDEQAGEIRVDGEGIYQNLKLFPKMYKVWIEGPIVKSDTVSVDLNSKPIYDLPFTVTPLTSPRIITATDNGTTINVEYEITENMDNTVGRMEVYCSTVKYPTAAIGTRANVYFTKTVVLSSLSGNVLIDGLESGVKYYLRVGSQANGAAVMNYSNQIIVNTD